MIKLGDFTIFDRMDWYADNETLFAQARERFTVLAKWLLHHNMLNANGIEDTVAGIDDDFSLSDRILTLEGTSFLLKNYEGWLFSEGTSDPITTEVLDAALK